MAKRGVKTVLFLGADGPAAAAHFNAVAGRMGLPWEAVNGPADRVVAVNRTGDAPAGAECWDVDGPSGDLVEREVMALVARILGGGERTGPPPAPEPPAAPPRKALAAKVGRETGGRRGKCITTVSELALDGREMAELAAVLKQKCGTGGTVKDGRIEIQGDARDRVVAELERLGYRVKRVGG
ncbi:MAG: translation initiation factor [Gemmataceae bacterium]